MNLNETDRDVSTEVAFPVPPYDFGGIFNGDEFPRPVENFRVWVDGREIKYQSELKAMVRGVDFSARLRQLGIDIVSFGHFDDSSRKEPLVRDFEKLSKQQQSELRRSDLFDESFPEWTVILTHHWQQTFPARRILHVRHEYSPVVGERITDLADLTSQKPETHHLSNFAQWCIDPPLRKTLIAAMRKESYGGVQWMDYILTTANTWKKPIKQFELIVERPKPDAQGKYYYISFCWDRKVEQPDPDHFVVRATNFVPTKELSVGQQTS